MEAAFITKVESFRDQDTTWRVTVYILNQNLKFHGIFMFR